MIDNAVEDTDAEEVADPEGIDDAIENTDAEEEAEVEDNAVLAIIENSEFPPPGSSTITVPGPSEPLGSNVAVVLDSPVACTVIVV